MGEMRGHAVVIGASIGGLLAARVLADAYEKVTVTDRDSLPPAAESRRGVPQGRHIHVLLPSGAGILEELFPGLIGGLIDEGTPVVRDFSEARASFGGHLLSDEPAPVPGVFVQPSRPYLEWHVRARVQALLAAGGDLALPEVPGPRPLPVRVINAYVNRYQTAAENDIVLTERFFRVAGLLEPPTRLLRPSTVLRVLAGHLRRRPAPATERPGQAVDAIRL
jgi:hypothetical protein